MPPPPDLPLEFHGVSPSGETELLRLGSLLDDEISKALKEQWKPDTEAVQRRWQLEPDNHWDWEELAEKCKSDARMEALCVSSGQNRIQAACVYEIGQPSVLLPTVRCIYVHRLSSAPWNREWLVSGKKTRGAGTALLSAMAMHSYQLGLGGRLLLATTPKAYEFYIKKGFVDTGEVSEEFPLLELPEENAVRLINRKPPNG